MGQAAAIGASLGIGAIQSYSQYKTDSAQVALNNKIINYNNLQSVKALATSMNAMEDQTTQLQQQMVDTSIDIQIAKAKGKGTVLANAGATGTSGGAVDMQLNDIDTQAAHALAKATLNKNNQLQQINYNEKAAESKAQSRMTLMEEQKPDAMSYILSGFGTAAKSYGGVNSAFTGIKEWWTGD